jgi:hypothetical protein
MKKLPSIKKTTNIVEQLKAGLPPASVGRPTATRGRGSPMQVFLPAETLKALKVRSAQEETTVRDLILNALIKDGYPVPKTELGDRRKRG